LRCEDFEKSISAYLDEELDTEETRRLEQHMATCSVCSATVRGVHQVRLALSGLGNSGAPASFRLGLPGRLQEELVRQQQLWIRPLAMGLALVAALAILLWPEPDQEAELSSYWQRRNRAVELREGMGTGPRRSTEAWAGRFVKLAPPGPYSHARIRTVSY
jgi:anti-sigma factor RsiW